MKKSNILVTGGAGYIGSHCIISLIKHGYNPIVIDNFCNSSKFIIYQIQKITKKNIKYYNFDVRNKKKLELVFKKHNFLSVIHFVGLKSVLESSKDPLKYFDNNILSSISLFECMKKYEVFKLIFSSSACVYNSNESLPWSETTKTGDTTNPYGTSKYIIERILMDLSKSDKRWKIGIARYFNPISNHFSGLIGENPKGIPNNLIPYITKVIRKDLPYLNIYGDDYKTKDGTGVRDYIHVMDLAEGHVKLLKYLAKIKGFEIFNFGSGNGYSVKNILNKFQKEKNIKIPFKIKSKRKGDLPIYYTSNKKAKKLLNWKPKNNLNTMIKDLCKFIYN
jgi:UDP-glucose 4-epimerase